MIDRHNAALAGAFALVLTVAAPGAMASGDHEGGHDQDREHEDQEHGHGHDPAFGEAAPEAAPDRTVEVVARDTMRYEPESITVEPGRVVRFVVHNRGQLQHSFTLGSPEYQRTHQREMKDMAPEKLAGHMEDNPNGVVVAPGDTGTVTWRFEAGGPIRFACHMPGHFQAGMKGRIRVE